MKTDDNKVLRLDRLLSEAGYMRSEARAMIARGRVRVEGRVISDAGHKTVPQAVEVDGAPIIVPGETHIMLYKPAGVVTATEDARADTVLSLLSRELRRPSLGPVGRLDKDATGLVLLTTDGQLAHRLMSPRWKAEKRYRVTCEGVLTHEEEERFRQGIAFSDFTTQPAAIKPLTKSNKCSVYEVAISEGKYHQIKRMFGVLGHPVLSLHRLSIAGLELDDSLMPGEARLLIDEEIQALYRRAGLDE